MRGKFEPRHAASFFRAKTSDQVAHFTIPDGIPYRLGPATIGGATSPITDVIGRGLRRRVAALIVWKRCVPPEELKRVMEAGRPDAFWPVESSAPVTPSAAETRRRA